MILTNTRRDGNDIEGTMIVMTPQSPPRASIPAVHRETESIRSLAKAMFQ